MGSMLETARHVRRKLGRPRTESYGLELPKSSALQRVPRDQDVLEEAVRTLVEKLAEGLLTRREMVRMIEM